MTGHLNWPADLERTPPEERERCTKFNVGYRRTASDLKQELEDRMGVETWRLEDVKGSGGDPGVVLRWTLDGDDYAAACDAYTQKGDNLRALYLWVHETRMRNQRPVVTAEDEFAAARLPSGDQEEALRVENPHEVLGVRPDASDAVVKAAFRQRKGETHPDSGGSKAEFQRVVKAAEMLGIET